MKHRVCTVIGRYKKGHGTECGADVNGKYQVISVTGSTLTRHWRNVEVAVTRTAGFLSTRVGNRKS
jgi:hypothetical protein